MRPGGVYLPPFALGPGRIPARKGNKMIPRRPLALMHPLGFAALRTSIIHDSRPKGKRKLLEIGCPAGQGGRQCGGTKRTEYRVQSTDESVE